MKKEWILLFLIALSLFTMQAIGGYFQIKDYKKAIRRVHRLGRSSAIGLLEPISKSSLPSQGNLTKRRKSASRDISRP